MAVSGGVATVQQEAVNMNPEAQDCYFYFYSSCSKGSSCKFRHCSAALGSEETCTLWRDDKCHRKVCAFRHSQMDRQRSAIPCYWETTPTGCLKAHCPFLHSKPRPQKFDFRERMSNYKMAAISVKTLEHLQREREEMSMDKGEGEEARGKKEEEERNKESEDRQKERVLGEQRRNTMMEGLNKVVDRNLAEQRKSTIIEGQRKKDKIVEGSLEKPRKDGRTIEKGEEGKDSKGSDIDALRKELMKRMMAEHKAFKERRASQTSQGEEPERSESTVKDPPPQVGHRIPVKHRIGFRGSHGDTASMVKVQLKNTATKENAKRETSQRSKKSAARKATPPRNPLDFKIKTLEELRAEKGKTSSSSSDPKPHPKPHPTTQASSAEKEKEDINYRPHPKPRPVGGQGPRRKKVVLVRRKMSQSHPTTTVSEPASPLKSHPHSIPADPASIPDNFDSSMRSQAKTSVPGLGKRTTCDSDSELETNPKRRKLIAGHVTMLRREGRDMELTERAQDDDGDDDVMVAGGDGRSQERKLSIAELRTEILQDLDPPTDDTDLLEEMALYEEQGEGLEEEGAVVGLSDSRNDDELILQMEELM